MFNLKAEKDSDKVNFEANLGAYCQLVLVAVDDDSVCTRIIDIENPSEIAMRDLRNNKLMNETKGLTESRLTVTLSNKPEDKHQQSDFIDDITASEVYIVDDLSKVNEILKEIKKISASTTEYTGDFTKLKFVEKWHRLKDDEKNRYFSEYTSYELHLFILKKDPSYFDKVVRPFITYKMEKYFMDYYLLGDFKKICEYADIDKLKELNALETCLLIDALVREGH